MDTRDTWSNSHVWPWSTEWSRQKVTEFCQENVLVISNTLFQQYQRQLYTWASPEGQYQNEIDYIVCRQRRKLRDTWSYRQIWTWSTNWSRGKANRVLPRECTGHSKHPLPTTHEKTLHMGFIRWSKLKSDWLHSLQPKMEKLYIVSKNKTGCWLVAQIINSWLPNSDLNWRK